MKNTILKSLTLALLCAAAVCLPALPASAAWGDRDPNFGFWGVFTDNCASDCKPFDAALQGDGKIIVTGSREIDGKGRMFLRRYLSNGRVDSTFGDNGFAVSGGLMNLDSSYSGSSILVQPDGKIVVAGVVSPNGGLGYPQIVVWRFTPSGAGDTGFGFGGMRVYPKSFWGLLSLNIAYQDGKLVIGYTDNMSSGIYLGTLARLHSNGQTDTTFGENGEIRVQTQSISILRNLLIEPGTNKIVTASEASTPSLLSRKLPDGAGDPYFQNWAVPFSAKSAGLVRLRSGKYLAAIADDSGSNAKRSVVKLSADGVWESQTPDYVETPGNEFHFLGVQQNGQIIAGSPNGFYRFNANLDDFSRESYTGANLPQMSSSPYAKSVLLQPDDKMVIVSQSSTGRITLTRVLPN